jgi:hypothetical protein
MRPYHSASSIALGLECERAWALCYIDKLREPEVLWADIESGAAKDLRTKQRSAALGTATHKVGELYWQRRSRDDEIDWTSLPGRIYRAMLDHLPQRDWGRIAAFTESPLGTDKIRVGDDDLEVLQFGGVAWRGSRDLLLVEDGELTLVDYKTSSDPKRWGKFGADLEDDPQANLYALSAMKRWWQTELDCRWIYGSTRRIGMSVPSDMRASYERSEAIVLELAEHAKHLDLIERSDDAPCNFSACEKYGGCYYSLRNTGLCTGRRSIGAAVQGRTMAINSVKNRFARTLAAQDAPVQAPAEAPAAAPPAAPQEAAPAAAHEEVREAMPGLPKIRKPRTRKAAPPAGIKVEDPHDDPSDDDDDDLRRTPAEVAASAAKGELAAAAEAAEAAPPSGIALLVDLCAKLGQITDQIRVLKAEQSELLALIRAEAEASE